jgi:hypothetical protein
MRIRARLLLCALTFLTVSSLACGSLFRRYEYEEDIYVSLDGSATVYVNSSLAALAALHGAPFDARQRASVDRAAVVRFFSTPPTRVRRVATSRHAGRPFVQVRIDVDDIRSLGQTAPFAGSTFSFSRDGDLLVYRQAVGASAGGPVAEVGWTGRELVGFRLHLPSKITYHNALPENLRRGNILVWEQPFSDRLRGVPIVLEARIETESILNQTLWLFGMSLLAVAVAFGAAIWWVVRKGKPQQESWRHVDPI